MSKYQRYATNALLNPYRAIKTTGSFSDAFLETVFLVFRDIIFPVKTELYKFANEVGEEETIILPAKTRFSNWNTNSGCFCHVFPYIYYNYSNKMAFYIGDDVIQVTNHKDFYAYAYCRNGVTHFNIIVINNGKSVLVELNSEDSKVRYYGLTSSKIEEIKHFLQGQAYLIEPESYEYLLELFTDVPVEGSYEESCDALNMEEMARALIWKCLNSPETITDIVEQNDNKTTYSHSWPNLELNHKVSNICEKSKQAKAMVTKTECISKCDSSKTLIPHHYCMRSNNNDIEELYFHFRDKEDHYCYIIPKKESDQDGNELSYVVLYIYDTATVAAFEKMLGTHLIDGAYLFLNDAINAGLYPCCISYREVDNIQESMQQILNNPTLITETKVYKKVCLRPYKTNNETE